jgi:hypothetical protein
MLTVRLVKRNFDMVNPPYQPHFLGAYEDALAISADQPSANMGGDLRGGDEVRFWYGGQGNA